MRRETTPVRPIMQVGELVEVLRSQDSSCFPVVTAGGDFTGSILRSTLCTILHRRAFMDDASKAPSVSFGDLQQYYPRFPDLADVRVEPTDQTRLIDINHFMDTGPYMVNETTSLSRTYRLFRNMGLRHLWVVDNSKRLLGVITRTELSHQELHHRATDRAIRSEGPSAAEKAHHGRV